MTRDRMAAPPTRRGGTDYGRGIELMEGLRTRLGETWPPEFQNALAMWATGTAGRALEPRPTCRGGG